MTIHWKVARFDEDEEPDPVMAMDCGLRIEGRIEEDGGTAGKFTLWYLAAEDLDSPRAFMELWDLNGEVCSIYEQIINPDHEKFREPLPRLLEIAPGLLVIEYIALRPAFRNKGLGLAVMREIVRCCADARTGAVLLGADPLQHLEWAYDHFDEEIRDLPWDGPVADGERLMHHFRGWGMQRLPRTRFMVAAPDVLTKERAAMWPPAPVADDWRGDWGLPRL